MQTNVPRSEWLRRQRIARVLPGFPAQPFKSLDDVEAHVGGEKVVCLMCGKEYENVLRHVSATHGLDGSEYRHRFNIPAKYSLAGSRLSELRSAVARRPEHREHIRVQRPKQPKGGIKSPLIKRDWIKLRHTDFSWHLEQARTRYERVDPPEGVASWSCFAKRLVLDPELKAKFKAARAERPVHRRTAIARKHRLLTSDRDRVCPSPQGDRSFGDISSNDS